MLVIGMACPFPGQCSSEPLAPCGPRRQVYLGGYEREEHAAEAYDVAVLKVKGIKEIGRAHV